MEEGIVNITLQELAATQETNFTLELFDITCAGTSLLVNFFVLYILIKSKLVQKASYFVIAHLTAFLIILLITEILRFMSRLSNAELMFSVLNDVFDHVIIIIYYLMFRYSCNSFTKDEEICKHRVRMLCIVVAAMIIYSISIILVNGELFYSLIASRMCVFVLLSVMVLFQGMMYLYNSLNVNVLQLAFVFTFFCCWFPDFLFYLGITEGNVLNFYNEHVSAIISYCNGFFNLTWLIIFDDRFRGCVKNFTSGDYKFLLGNSEEKNKDERVLKENRALKDFT